MGRLGFTEKMTVKKVRESYRLNDIIVEVDKVEGLGDFIEIELRGQLQVQDLKVLVDKLGIEWMPIKDGYADMLFKIKKP